jgi:hypothetical protein
MAAYYEGARPGSRFHMCGPVVRRALYWADLWDDQTEHDYQTDQDNPLIEACYEELIALIRHQPEEKALVEGRGNLGSAQRPPALPPYTACRLTRAGVQAAEQLLAEHPQFRAP